MAAQFNEVLPVVIEAEGGYRFTDDPADRGGQTVAGITRKNWPDERLWVEIDKALAGGLKSGDYLSGDLHRLAHTTAQHVYHEGYWKVMRLGQLRSIEAARAIMLCGVLAGPSTAIELVQTTINNIMDEAAVAVDGIMGPQTLNQISKRTTLIDDQMGFLAMFGISQIARYTAIANLDPTQRRYLRGWCNRVLREIGI